MDVNYSYEGKTQIVGAVEIQKKQEIRGKALLRYQPPHNRKPLQNTAKTKDGPTRMNIIDALSNQQFAAQYKSSSQWRKVKYGRIVQGRKGFILIFYTSTDHAYEETKRFN